jgi:hypothetical protein
METLFFGAGFLEVAFWFLPVLIVFDMLDVVYVECIAA